MEEEERYAEHVSVRLYVKKLAKPCVVIDAVAKRFSQSSLRRGFFFIKRKHVYSCTGIYELSSLLR